MVDAQAIAWCRLQHMSRIVFRNRKTAAMQSFIATSIRIFDNQQLALAAS